MKDEKEITHDQRICLPGFALVLPISLRETVLRARRHALRGRVLAIGALRVTRRSRIHVVRARLELVRLSKIQGCRTTKSATGGTYSRSCCLLRQLNTRRREDPNLFLSDQSLMIADCSFSCCFMWLENTSPIVSTLTLPFSC